MSFVLQTGLALRRGAQTIELVRQLDDVSWAYEECQTRRPGVIATHELVNGVWSGKLALVSQARPSRSESDEPAQPALLARQDLKPAHHEDLARKMTYVIAMRQAHLRRGMRTAIEQLVGKVAASMGDAKPPSASTVMRWVRHYEKSHCSALSLVTRNAHRRRKAGLHPLMDAMLSEALRKVYLTRARNSLRHTLAVVHAQARSLVAEGKLREEDSEVSLSTLSRRVRQLDAYRVIEAREGAARARMVCRTSMVGTTAQYPLDVVEIDHTPLNWVVLCDRTGLPLGRPLLTVLIDAYSGYVLGFYVSFYGPGLSSVSGALRCAIRPKADLVADIKLENPWLSEGIPDTLVVDNGLEFHSVMFQRIGWDIGTHFTYSRVRTPWVKPHVERFFASLDTWTLARGRIHKRVANVLNMDPNKDAAIMFSAFVKGLVMYAVDYHPFQINERKLARPFDLMREGLQRVPPVRFPEDMERLRMVSGLSKQLTVHQGGIELHGLPFGGPELLPMRKANGERFKAWVKWDPDDMGHLWIQDPRTESWVSSPCRWTDYASGLSWNQHLQIRRFAREQLKSSGAYEHLERARLRLHEHWQESIAWKTSADRKLAARYAGATSAKVLEPVKEAPAKPAVVPTSVEEIKTMPAPAREEFETLDF